MSHVYLELKGDHQHKHTLSLIGHLHDHVASNKNSYFFNSNYPNSTGVQATIDHYYSRSAQEKVEKLVISEAKSNDVSDQILASPQQLQYTPDGSDCCYNYPCDHQHIGRIDRTANIKQSKKGKVTKLRIMHQMRTKINKSKITRDDHRDQNHDLAKPHHTTIYRGTGNEISSGFIRVCTDCHTTTTPLWRSGPQGPKSLCNACGIRQRKARRAAMATTAAAAAELANYTTVVASPISDSSYIESPNPKVEEMIKPERKLNNGPDMSHTLPIKKRTKMTDHTSWSYNSNGDKVYFRDFKLSSSSKNCFTHKYQRVFPRDEEEGAILLMALSCGLAWSS